MFSFTKKQQSTDNNVEPTDLKSITENLYKQNSELAIKNKTLSLLRQLYQISILALDPKPLAEEIVESVRGALEFELVGMMMYDEKTDTLNPLAFSFSDRLNTAQTDSKMSLSCPITNVSKNPFLTPIFNTKQLHHSTGITELWGTAVAKNAIDNYEAQAHIKTSIGYPLVINEKLMGIIVMCLNRTYESLVAYERESIASFVDVIAVAVDKSLLYQELNTTNAKLKELDQQKTQFISLATHQIRAPLSAIKGYGSLIMEGDYGDVSPEVREAVQTMYLSAHNLVGVVGDYLDISRMELGHMRFDFAKFELNPLIEQLVKELQPNIMSKQLTLTYTPADSKDPFPIVADMGKVKQIIGNLIDNSLKYTPEGSVIVGLEHKDQNKILISIKDTGVGIAAETIPKLFQRFSRADDAHNTNILGTGLGLFIVKQMVEAHKGKVWVESKGKGHGSEFYIELPNDLQPGTMTQEAVAE